MKKLLVSSIILGAFSVGAQAQSSVTLYGLIDAGLKYTKEKSADGSKGTFGFTEMNTAGNRFGLKGSEEIGAGTSFVFNLEGGFSITNGASKQTGLFGRRAILGIDDKDYGRLTFGLQTDAPDHLLNGDVNGIIDFGNDNFGTLSNREAQILYLSPTLAGFKFGVSYGPGGTVATGHQWGKSNKDATPVKTFSNDHGAVAVAYEVGDLKLSTALNYVKYNHGTAGTKSNPSNLSTHRSVSLGAEYDFSVLQLGLRFEQYRMKFHGADPTASAGTATKAGNDYFWGIKTKRYEITLAAPVSESGTLYAGLSREVTRERASENADKKKENPNIRVVEWTNKNANYLKSTQTRTHFFRLSYVEKLSKRTQAYTGYGFKHESHYNLEGKKSNTDKAHYFTVGVVHRF